MQAEAQELIISCDCPQYLAKAEKRLAEESQRVALYLDPSTEAKVVRVAETALIQQQASLLVPKPLWLVTAWCSHAWVQAITEAKVVGVAETALIQQQASLLVPWPSYLAGCCLM